jgi:2',3'-cyclic-nucleotide 2'-phosphodiesterase/3'-nucleotidase
VQAVVINGAQVRNWLEMSAAMFNQVQPGAKDADLLNASFPSYNFDVIDGVSYQIDLSQPRRFDDTGKIVNANSHRIQNLQFGGKPIDETQKFVVVSNNYRAGGGGNFPEIAADKVVYQAPDTNRDVIVRYIHDQGTINPTADGNWTFASMPGTTVLFESAPKARDFLGEVKTVKIEDAGEGTEGFHKFRLVL